MSGQQSAHAPDCASYDFDPEKQLGLDKPCDCGAAVDLRCVACPACGVAIGEACLDSAGAGRTCLRRTAAALRFNANVNDETCGQRTAALSEGATYWCMKQKGHEGTEHEALREDGTVYFWRGGGALRCDPDPARGARSGLEARVAELTAALLVARGYVHGSANVIDAIDRVLAAPFVSTPKDSETPADQVSREARAPGVDDGITPDRETRASASTRHSPPAEARESRGAIYYCASCKDTGCSECDVPDVNDDHNAAAIERAQRTSEASVHGICAATTEGAVAALPLWRCVLVAGHDGPHQAGGGRDWPRPNEVMVQWPTLAEAEAELAAHGVDVPAFLARTRQRVAEAKATADLNATSWPLHMVVWRLANAVDHLLHDHDCDAHGHEGVLYALQAARTWLDAAGHDLPHDRAGSDCHAPAQRTQEATVKTDIARAVEVADYVKMGPGWSDVRDRVLRLLSDARREERRPTEATAELARLAAARDVVTPRTWIEGGSTKATQEDWRAQCEGCKTAQAAMPAWWLRKPACSTHGSLPVSQRSDQATPKGMLPEKVREAFAASRALLPADLPALRHAPDWRQHIVFMCEEGSSYVEGRREKAMRWLGFVQGALWAHGLAPIEDLKNMNRPEPHHLDKATKAPGEST